MPSTSSLPGETMPAPLRPDGQVPFADIAEDIRAVFAECEARAARFTETGKRSDRQAWKRYGGVLEVVCVGHMRRALDEIDALTAVNAELLAACKALITYDERDDSGPSAGIQMMVDYNEAILLARAAIARAEPQP